MGGQILGGGAIALVVAVLWLVYFLPSLQAKLRYNAAERNAVRLNQALRVLAESSEMPGEVRVELSRREVARQHRLARRLEAEDDRLRAEYERAEVERKKRAHEAKLERTKHDAERERIERAVSAEQRRLELAALRSDPRVRMARARRRVRLSATIAGLVGVAMAAFGAWLLIASSSWVLMAAGIALAVASALVLRRMATVASRAQRREKVSVEPAVIEKPRAGSRSQILDPADRGWTPRSLPAPLTATAGSSAADTVAAAAARTRLAQAEREAEARARMARRNEPTPLVANGSDDAAIEQHVRELLARRAAG